MGDTDYTGVSIEDICVHLRDWLNDTNRTVEKLQQLEVRIEEQRDRLENPDEALRFVGFFQDLFSRYAADFQRVVDEIPDGVLNSHVETLRQILESARLEDKLAITFKNDWVYKTLPHEDTRPLLDDINGTVRGRIGDYEDLSNVVRRLRSFAQPTRETTESFPNWTLKPGMFGIGINLNRMLPRVLRRWKRRG